MLLSVVCRIASPIYLKRNFCVVLVVEACSKVFRGCFSCFFVWSFSMLLDVAFLWWGCPDDGLLILHGVDGVECLD